jgi:hypothetical protein
MAETIGYKQDRLEEQIKWHSKKARYNPMAVLLLQIRNTAINQDGLHVMM